jgi:hypothetical protein
MVSEGDITPSPVFGGGGAVIRDGGVMRHDPLRQRKTLTPPPKTGEGDERMGVN